MRFFPAILLILRRPAPLRLLNIVSDDQGYNDLGVLGDHIITPNLDRLANEGVRLTNLCRLAGLRRQAAGVPDGPLSAAQRHLRHDSQRSARLWPPVHAGGIRRHLGTDWRHGHLRFFCPKCSSRRATIRASSENGTWACSGDSCPWPAAGTSSTALSMLGIDYTHEALRRAVHVSKQRADDRGPRASTRPTCSAARPFDSSRKQARPFFFTCPFNAPHARRASIRSFLGRAGGEVAADVPALYARRASSTARHNKPGKVANKALRMTNYLGAVTAMDAAIGEVLDLTRPVQLAGNTIVIFFSDNGGGWAATTRGRGKFGV